MLKLRDLQTQIDYDLRQGNSDGRVTVAENSRLIKTKQLAFYVNQTLSYLCGLNQSLWQTQLPVPVLVTSDTLQLPKSFAIVQFVIIGGTRYNVGSSAQQNNYQLYLKEANVIASTSSMFTAGDTVTVVGTAYPAKLPTTGLDEDILEAVIDIDQRFEDLIRLNVLKKYFALGNTQMPFVFAEYQEQLATFRKATPSVNVKSIIYNKINFGRTY